MRFARTVFLLCCAGCLREPSRPVPLVDEPPVPPMPIAEEAPPTPEKPAERLARALRERGITDERVLAAVAKVPRHRFVPPEHAGRAYRDHPLPIGLGQTISQPFIVAYMTQALALSAQDVVLEIGTGSGYQAAILAELVKQVYTIEILPELAERARRTLHELGYHNVEVRTGDGYRGWPEHAPFPKIMVTAAPERLPQGLLEQLAPGGRLVLPLGAPDTVLMLYEKGAAGLSSRRLLDVRFVPMTGGPG